MKVYLDNSATTRQSKASTEVMLNAIEEIYGNPSSLHLMGIVAEKALKEARKTIGETLGISPKEIIFNSGGSEGNNSVIKGVAFKRKKRFNKIITTQVEHPSVLEACKFLENNGFQVKYLPVDNNCSIDLEELKEEITEEASLMSIMSVNNEVGAIFPIKEIGELKKNALFHTDGVQGVGKLDYRGFKGDFISASGHKFHGPKGVGFIYAKDANDLEPLIHGGGQENNSRSGTENIPAILALSKAVEEAYRNREKNMQTMSMLRNKLLTGIEDNIEDIKINSPTDGLASILNISFLGVRGEVLLHTLERDGIFVSTGSACSSNKKGQSHVLKAMGLKDKEIEGAIRFSFSKDNTEEEIDFVLEKLIEAVKTFRRLGSFR